MGMFVIETVVRRVAGIFAEELFGERRPDVVVAGRKVELFLFVE